MKTNRKFFTIIELLIVIAIIGVLMALLFPTFHIVRKKAKMAKAQSQVNAIVMAIKNYETTYGLLPWDDGDTGTAGIQDSEWDDIATTGSDDDEYDTLIQILAKADMTNGTYSDADTGALTPDAKLLGNIRSVRFLDVPSNFATYGFLDPWNNRYAIAMDLDYDGQVNAGGGIGTLNGTVFVYSFGADGADDNGASADIQGHDDVSSWSSQ